MEWSIVFGALCTVTDCAWQRVERWVLLTGAVMGAAAAGCRIRQGAEDWFGIGLALLPGLMLWAFSWLTEEKIGRGDGDMVMLLGLLLGWQQCMAVLCKACFLLALYAGVGLASGRMAKNSRLPFAPFLLAATVFLWMLTMCRT